MATENLLNRHRSRRLWSGAGRREPEHTRAGNAGERDTLGRRGASAPPSLTSPGCPAAAGRCQVFTVPTGAGKLKNWKSEKLTAGTPAQIARISDFQDFRFSPTHATPEILPTGPGGCERPERQVYAHNRTFMGGLYKHRLNGKERP